MAHDTQCPNCQNVGFVRAEYIIHKNSTTPSYHCERCDYQWPIPESVAATKPTFQPLPRPQVRALRSKRS